MLIQATEFNKHVSCIFFHCVLYVCLNFSKKSKRHLLLATGVTGDNVLYLNSIFWPLLLVWIMGNL